MENKKSLVGALVALVAVIALAAVAYNVLGAQGTNAVPDIGSATAASSADASAAADGAQGADASAAADAAQSGDANTATNSAQGSAQSGAQESDTLGGAEQDGANQGGAATSAAAEASAGSSAQSTEPMRFNDFSFSTLDGDTVKLSDFYGKPTLLGFWATWCPPCNREAPEIQKLFDTYGDQVNFVMVDEAADGRDSAEVAKQWMETNGYTYPVYVDETGGAAQETQMYYLPTMFVLDKEGNVLTGFSGALDEASGSRLIEQLLAL